jgi:two-component system chemotaxis sensor kinase CheA
MIGELVVVEAMVVGAPEIAHSASARVRNCLSQLEKVTHDLQDVGMRMRMLPVSGVFQKMARMARDVGRKAGKQVRVVLSGEQTEMDRSMVEQISDPLVHMIRNSIDHGIEPPDVRRKVGKPEEGKVRLSASHEGGHVVIEIADDGRGLNREAILKKAIAQGLIKATDILPEDEINALIFAPGFSTAEKVTDISGRGVGMDVVRRNIDAMRGQVTIKTIPGQGTTFKITLPLTLAIIDGMLVVCGKERYIIPTLSIIESIQPEPSMLVTQGESNEMLNMRGNILPLLRMDKLLGAKGAIQDPGKGLVVIIEGSGRRVGLLVDEVIAQQQVVIKSMGEGVGDVPFVSGAAILSDGRVGLIVNVEGIVSLVVDRRHRGFAGEGSLASVGAASGAK